MIILDEQAFFAALTQEQPRLERIAWAMLGRRADVEDALQEAASAGQVAGRLCKRGGGQP